MVAITANWKRSFCELREAVVEAQADMLCGLGWSLRLDLATGALGQRASLLRLACVLSGRRLSRARLAAAPCGASLAHRGFCSQHRPMCDPVCPCFCPPSRSPAEVKPCLELLFRLPQGGAAEPSSPREAWARRMHRICSFVQRQVGRDPQLPAC